MGVLAPQKRRERSDLSEYFSIIRVTNHSQGSGIDYRGEYYNWENFGPDSSWTATLDSKCLTTDFERVLKKFNEVVHYAENDKTFIEARIERHRLRFDRVVKTYMKG
jgi:hypothetical protein